MTREEAIAAFEEAAATVRAAWAAKAVAHETWTEDVAARLRAGHTFETALDTDEALAYIVLDREAEAAQDAALTTIVALARVFA